MVKRIGNNQDHQTNNKHQFIFRKNQKYKRDYPQNYYTDEFDLQRKKTRHKFNKLKNIKSGKISIAVINAEI